jgi:ASC-1-like (ASCH) protein
LAGWTLARGHARSGDRIAMASYLGEDDGFERAIAEFASIYADVNERDHGLLAEEIKQGRIPAISGV